MVNPHRDGESRRQPRRCAICTGPVDPGALRVYESDEFVHAACRNLHITRAALQQYGAGEDGPTVEASGPTAGSPEPEAPVMRTCPICQESATVARDAADAASYVVEGCACGGYAVAAEVLEWRLSRLTAAERAELVATLQGFRAMGRGARLSTGDERGISGRLVIRTHGERRYS